MAKDKFHMDSKQREAIKSQIYHEVMGYRGMWNLGIKDLAKQLDMDEKTLYNLLSGANNTG